jgi:hypothetical protein
MRETMRKTGSPRRPKVIDFKEAGARIKAKKNGKGEQGSVAHAAVLEMLGKVAPLDDETVELLAIPQKLFMLDELSFSSEPSRSAQGIGYTIFMRSLLPEDLPDYAIELFGRGSNVFCALVDKKRKVIVFDSISNMYVKEGGSWASFVANLKDALSRVKALEAEGAEFRYVVSNESNVTVV